VTLFIGIYPAPILDVMHASVAHLLEQYDAAIKAARAAGELKTLNLASLWK